MVRRTNIGLAGNLSLDGVIALADINAAKGGYSTLQAKVQSQGFDVIDYGADPTGVTDSTAAINAAIAAIPSTGGTLHFPAGTFKSAGGHVISVPCTISGEGSGNFADAAAGNISLINCSSATASLFTVTADTVRFEKVALKNTAVSTPSAGAGITVAGTHEWQRIDYEGIVVGGFYVGVDVQTGSHWGMHSCSIVGVQKYGLKIQNTIDQDEGDFTVSDCWFQSVFGGAVADAGIRIEGGGGGRIANTRINGAFTAGGGFVHGIDLCVAPGVVTGELYIIGNGIDGFRGSGIRYTYQDNTGQWYNVQITGNYLNPFVNTIYPAIELTGIVGGSWPDAVTIVGNLFESFDAGSRPAIVMTQCMNILMASNLLIGTGYTSLFSQTLSASIVRGPGSSLQTALVNMLSIPGLIGYWRSGEGSGTVAADASGHGITGTYVNAPTLGVAGGLAGDPATGVTYVASSSQAVTLGTVTALSLATDITIVARVKKASAPAAAQQIFSRRDGSLTGYQFFIASDGTAQLFCGDGTHYSFATSPGSVCDGNWHDIAVMRAGAVGRVDLDGVTVESLATQFASVGSMAGSIAAAIGEWVGQGQNIDATVMEVAVFNRGLTRAETSMIHWVMSTT